MRVLKGQDLMQGSDHDFIVQLYRRILLRGPDEGGYRNYVDQIEADPGCRRRLIEEFSVSSEAQRQSEALHIIWDDEGAMGTVVSASAEHESAVEELLVLLRQKLAALDDTKLSALEVPLLECLEALLNARLKALKQGT